MNALRSCCCLAAPEVFHREEEVQLVIFERCEPVAPRERGSRRVDRIDHHDFEPDGLRPVTHRRNSSGSPRGRAEGRSCPVASSAVRLSREREVAGRAFPARDRDLHLGELAPHLTDLGAEFADVGFHVGAE